MLNAKDLSLKKKKELLDLEDASTSSVMTALQKEIKGKVMMDEDHWVRMIDGQKLINETSAEVIELCRNKIQKTVE